MRNNGTVEYCEHCGKKTYHYPDGGCASCYANACDNPDMGEARRKKMNEKDKMVAEVANNN